MDWSPREVLWRQEKRVPGYGNSEVRLSAALVTTTERSSVMIKFSNSPPTTRFSEDGNGLVSSKPVTAAKRSPALIRCSPKDAKAGQKRKGDVIACPGEHERALACCDRALMLGPEHVLA